MKPVQFDEKGAGRVMVELARQYEPRSALREFTTNALDAKIPKTTLFTSILLIPNYKRIVISDLGCGMTNRELAEKPMKIGYSQKYGYVDKRGEKGLGLLSFGSLGQEMDIISKHYEEGLFGHVKWIMRKEGLDYDDKNLKIEPSEVESHYYGIFPNGTRVIINGVSPHIFKNILTPAYLKKQLALLYNPAILREDVIFEIGRVSGRDNEAKFEDVLSIDYEDNKKKNSAIEVINKIIELNIPGQEPGKLEVLLYVDPTAVQNKPGIYTKDVLVYESVSELAEFNRSPVWTSGKISGFINDNISRLSLGRDGIDRRAHTFKAWYEAMKEIEGVLSPHVEKSRVYGKHLKERDFIKQAYDILKEVWPIHKRNELGTEYTRSSTGETRVVTGTEPTKSRGKKGGRERTGTGKGPGPGTFEENPEGHPEKVVKKTGVPVAFPQPIEFDIHEKHLRSKLEDKLGSPTIFINSSHEDYRTRVELKDNKAFVAYIWSLMAKEAAYYEVLEQDKKEKLLGNKLETVQLALQKTEDLTFLGLKRLGIN